MDHITHISSDEIAFMDLTDKAVFHSERSVVLVASIDAHNTESGDLSGQWVVYKMPRNKQLEDVHDAESDVVTKVSETAIVSVTLHFALQEAAAMIQQDIEQ